MYRTLEERLRDLAGYTRLRHAQKQTEDGDICVCWTSAEASAGT